MAKLDNNQNTEKLTTRDKAQVSMLANSISAQLISFFGKNFGSLNSNFSNLNQEISNVSENISSVNNSSYSHIIRELNKSLNISKSFIKKHLDSASANELKELQERKKFLEESNEDNSKELKATNKEIIKITRKLAKDLRGQQAKALAEEAKVKNEARLEEEQQYKVKTRQVDTPESLQQKLKGFIKDPYLDISRLTVKDRVSMVSDLKSGVAPEKILAQIKSLQKSNLEKRMDAFNAENAYYKRENSFYEDLAEVQKDLLKFQDKREQYFDYAEKVVGKLHEQEISVQDRKRLAYDTERKNYIEALKLSKLQQQIEDTRAKTWFLEGGLTKNMIAYQADSEKYIQTIKDNFKNKLLQPFRTMKKWWSNTKSIFSFSKDLIGSFFGRKPTGTQKQSEQVNNKAEVNKDDTERIKEQQETEEYHNDILSKFDKLLDFFLGTKTASAIKEKKSTPIQAAAEGSGGSNWLSWLAIASNLMPGKLLKGIWGLGKFGVKEIGAALKGIGKFALNPVAATKAIGKSVAAAPGAIKTFATKKATDIGKSVVSKATAIKQFAVNKVNAVKSTASEVVGKAIAVKDTAIKKATAFKNVVANSETGQAVAKGFNFVKEKVGKAAGGIKEAYKAKGLWGVRSFLQGAITKFVPKGLLAQFKNLYAKFAKPVAKLLVKFGGTAGLKAAAKGLPGLGAILGIVFAIHRAAKGDWWGALLELASGLAGGLLPPGVGLAVSAGIEAALAYKDFKTAKEEESPALAPAKINTNAGWGDLTEEDKEIIALERIKDTYAAHAFGRKRGNSATGRRLQKEAEKDYWQADQWLSDKVQSSSPEAREKYYARLAVKFLKDGDTLEDLPTEIREAYLKHQDTPATSAASKYESSATVSIKNNKVKSIVVSDEIKKETPAKSVTTKSKPLPKIERAPVNNNNTQQNNNNGRDDAKLVGILERIDSKIGNVAENTANPRVTSIPVPMETSVADYSGGANAQMQGI